MKLSNINQIQNQIKESLSDNDFSKTEYQQLKSIVENSSDLSPETKGEVLNFLADARDKSDGWFFGLIGKGISKSEMASLDNIVKTNSDNPILSKLKLGVDNIKKEPNLQTVNQTNNFKGADFNPISKFFSSFLKPDSNDKANSSDKKEATFDPKKFYVSQNGNGLASGGGDCGPACASMVMKAFDELPENISNGHAIKEMRRGAGVTKSRGGAWAITEGEITKAIKSKSKNTIKEVGNQKFNKNQKAGFMNFLKQQLDNKALPIVLLGSPYSGKGRHYMVVSEIKPNGNLSVSDPGGKKQWEMTPEKLGQLMKKADNRGGSRIMAYSK